MSHTVKKITSNTIYQLLGKVVSMSITVLTTLLITRIYGRAAYGDFNLMQNLPAIFFIITDFGLNAIAVREISQNSHLAQKYFSNILSIRILISLIFFFVILIGVYAMPYGRSLQVGIQLGSLILFTQALYATSNIIFQSRLKYSYAMLSYILGSVVVLVLVLLFTYLKLDIIWINFTYIIGGLTTFALTVQYLKKLNIVLKLEFDKTFAKSLFISTLPLGLMFVFSQINFKADSILLSVLNTPSWMRFSNSDVVALYGLPYKIFEVMLVLPTFIMNSVYPVMLDEHQKGSAATLKIFRKTMLSLIILGSMVSISGYFASPLIINLLGGADFTQSVDVLRILLSGIFIFFLTQPISWLIVTLGKQKYLPFVYAVGAIFNVYTNYLYIPKYSFWSSSVITLLSELLILVLLSVSAYVAWRQKYASVK